MIGSSINAISNALDNNNHKVLFSLLDCLKLDYRPGRIILFLVFLGKTEFGLIEEEMAEMGVRCWFGFQES